MVDKEIVENFCIRYNAIAISALKMDNIEGLMEKIEQYLSVKGKLQNEGVLL
jgi:hypothetical protein